MGCDGFDDVGLIGSIREALLWGVVRRDAHLMFHRSGVLKVVLGLAV